MKYKFKRQITNNYKFKKFYLINKDWLEKYKEFFLYDFIIKRFKEEYNKEYNDEEIIYDNDKNNNHKKNDKEKNNNLNNNNANDNNNEDKEILLYENIIFNIDEIVGNIGQIALYKETQVEDLVRDFQNIIPEMTKTKIQRKVLKKDLSQVTEEIELVDNYLNIPHEFCLINKDILQLLQKEEFFFNIKENFINKIEYQILLGNNRMIIKNKPMDNNDERFNNINEYLVYIDKEERNKYLEDNDIKKKDSFILYYILNYSKNESFFKDLKILNKKNGLYEYIMKNNNIDLTEKKIEENIKDKNGNILGNFINIRINIENINNENIPNNVNNENQNENKLIENNNNANKKNIEKDKDNEKNKESQILNDINKNNNKDNENKKNEAFKDLKIIYNEINLNIQIDNKKKKYNKNKNEININYPYNDEDKTDKDINQYNNNINIINEIHNNNNLNEFEGEEQIEYNNLNNSNHKNKINIIEEEKGFIIKEEEKEEILKNIFKSFNEFLKKNDISKLFEDIKEKNGERNDLEISLLNQKEIESNKNSTNAVKILLINEENLNEFKSFINYDIINKISKINKGKRKYIRENFNEFYNFVLFLEDKIKIPPNISLIENYDYFEDNINKKNKFYILYESKKLFKKIIGKKKIEETYYFLYKNGFYIYFTNNKKILEIKAIDNNFWELMDINKDNSNDKINIITLLNDKIKENKNTNNMKKYLDINYKDFKNFYLINEEWIDSKLNNKNNYVSFIPETKKTGFEDYEYPENFRFIEENNFELINELKKNENINDIELYKTKMFFVCDDSFYKNKLYFGILPSNKNDIYFYSFKQQNYTADFLIHYEDNDLLFFEIKNQILTKGIEAYLYEMGVNYNREKKQNLFNFRLEKIGLIYFLNSNLEYNYPLHNSNTLENIKDSHYYNGVIQCLINIRPLKHIFLNRSRLVNSVLVDKKNINENKVDNNNKKKITLEFYKLIQYMWHKYYPNENNEDNNGNQAIIFLSEINNISKEKNLFSNIKYLIQFILLSMHFEQRLNENNNKEIKYNLKEFKKTFHEIKNTFISDLFFFELEKSKCCKNTCSTNHMIVYLMDSFNKKDKERDSINIDSILSQANMEILCNNCKKKCNSKIKFITFPKILIIVLIPKKENNIKFYYDKKLDIGKYSSKKNNIANSHYNLISLIKKFEKGFITFCKASGDNDIWYRYKETDTIQNIKDFNSFNCVTESKDFPYLLIYQQNNQ